MRFLRELYDPWGLGIPLCIQDNRLLTTYKWLELDNLPASPFLCIPLYVEHFFKSIIGCIYIEGVDLENFKH